MTSPCPFLSGGAPPPLSLQTHADPCRCTCPLANVRGQLWVPGVRSDSPPPPPPPRCAGPGPWPSSSVRRPGLAPCPLSQNGGHIHPRPGVQDPQNARGVGGRGGGPHHGPSERASQDPLSGLLWPWDRGQGWDAPRDALWDSQPRSAPGDRSGGGEAHYGSVDALTREPKVTSRRVSRCVSANALRQNGDEGSEGPPPVFHFTFIEHPPRAIRAFPRTPHSPPPGRWPSMCPRHSHGRGGGQRPTDAGT